MLRLLGRQPGLQPLGGEMYPKAQQGNYGGGIAISSILVTMRFGFDDIVLVKRDLGQRQGIWVGDSIILVCAILASLASGVLAAYGVCLAMFRVFQIHAAQTEVDSERHVAGVVQAVEG